MNRLIALGVLAALSQLAHAHTELASSMPADRAALDTAPEQVMLHFSEPVRLTALGVQQSGGVKHDLGPLPAAVSKDFEIPAPAGLTAGSYTVSWRAMSEDTHVMTGEFVFTVGQVEHAGHAAPEAAQHADHSSH